MEIEDFGATEMTATVRFEQVTTIPELQQGEIHIWHARWEQFVGVTEEMQSVLSTEERERADKFKFKKDRDMYAMSRGILRKLLGGYLRVSPSALEFRYASHGKPYLAEKASGCSIQFNVSHSYELVLLAFSGDQEIGVDIEHIRKNFEFEDIAKKFLTSQTLAKMDGMGDEERTKEFFRLWTRMEACAKARGIGISLLDDALSFALVREEVCNSSEHVPNGKVEDFAPESGYVGSVASLSSISSLKHWNYLHAPQR